MSLRLLFLYLPLAGVNAGASWWVRILEAAVVVLIVRWILNRNDGKKNERLSAQTAQPLQRVVISRDAAAPLNLLSVWAGRPFVLDGITCASMGSFLCALWFQDRARQAEICAMSASEASAYAAKPDENDTVADPGTACWAGQAYVLRSEDLHELLTRAFRAQYAAPGNEAMMAALRSTAPKVLDCSDFTLDTPVTKAQFIQILTELRPA